MLARGIHHVGIAVDDLDTAVETYTRLFGATVEHRGVLQDQGVRAVSLLVGAGRVELMVPTGGDTPVGRFLSRRGPGLHHIAYEVDDVSASLTALRAEGATLIDEEARPGLFGLQVAFVHPDAVHGVLTEVVCGG